MMKKIFSLMLLCTALVIASCGNDDDTTSLAVTGVTLDNTTLSITVGETGTLKATVSPENVTDKSVTWSSDKTDIATVKDGVVTAVKAGTANIIATSVADASKKATCVVTAINYVNVNGLKVAIGNLVADGANGAKIGTPTDGGLFFQFGSLIGWSSAEPLGIVVQPASFNGKKDWTDTGKVWQGTEGVVPFIAAGSDNEKAGIGDPCRYYLKGAWRLPTKDECEALFKDGGYPSTGPWKWDDTSKSATNSTLNLAFPASGYRANTNGTLRNVGVAGNYWSGSSKASDGCHLTFMDTSVYDSSSSRMFGMPVRCVQEKASN